MPTVDISRTGNEENERIEIRLTLDVGRSITIEMTVEQFALAVTGRSNNPCRYRTRNLDIVEVKKASGKCQHTSWETKAHNDRVCCDCGAKIN